MGLIVAAGYSVAGRTIRGLHDGGLVSIYGGLASSDA